ncbi:unnamed protein product [Prorocentrum cordatum]|uniref:Uncharacterized protein n=1 Tax=Prorocentrum cordatum TaxID=2364126 RepID=A0ABN9T7L0_9DINO|nr:unnamed protein product [Polarella glacialis]
MPRTSSLALTVAIYKRTTTPADSVRFSRICKDGPTSETESYFFVLLSRSRDQGCKWYNKSHVISFIIELDFPGIQEPEALAAARLRLEAKLKTRLPLGSASVIQGCHIKFTKPGVPPRKSCPRHVLEKIEDTVRSWLDLDLQQSFVCMRGWGSLLMAMSSSAVKNLQDKLAAGAALRLQLPTEAGALEEATVSHVLPGPQWFLHVSLPTTQERRLLALVFAELLAAGLRLAPAATRDGPGVQRPVLDPEEGVPVHGQPLEFGGDLHFLPRALEDRSRGCFRGFASVLHDEGLEGDIVVSPEQGPLQPPPPQTSQLPVPPPSQGDVPDLLERSRSREQRPAPAAGGPARRVQTLRIADHLGGAAAAAAAARPEPQRAPGPLGPALLEVRLPQAEVAALRGEHQRAHAERLERWGELNRSHPIPEYLRPFVTPVLKSAEEDVQQVDRFVNVGVLGSAGTGRTSLIERLLEAGASPDLESFQRVKGGTCASGAPKRYQIHHSATTHSIWDLPNASPTQRYLRDMGLLHFDIILVTTNGHMTDDDENLFQVIKLAQIRTWLIRTMIDVDVETGQNVYDPSMPETLMIVRETLVKQLNEPDPMKIHLVTTQKQHWESGWFTRGFGDVRGLYKQLSVHMADCGCISWDPWVAIFGLEAQRHQYEDHRGRRLSVATYKDAIRALAKGGHVERALWMFVYMDSQGITPDAGTYGALISALAMDRTAGVVLKRFARMRDGEKCQLLEKTLNDFESMVERGSAPEPGTVALVVSMCRQEERPADALRVLEAAIRGGLLLDTGLRATVAGILGEDRPSAEHSLAEACDDSNISHSSAGHRAAMAGP